MSDWKTQSCQSVGEVPAMPSAEVDSALTRLPGWKISSDGKRIARCWKVKHFVAGIEFFKHVAELAEAEDHHPDLHLVGYRQVRIESWTHSVDGISVKDLILAAKIDDLPVELFEADI
jgi:4a-hydroxytetrahydrobiopterin dehydratase